MGVQINRIEKEFIFTNLLNQTILLTIHGDKKERLFRIGAFQDERLEIIEVEEKSGDFEKDEEIRAFFPFHDNYYTFTSKVLERTAAGLVIANPKSIYRDPQRKYERVRLKGMKLFFHLEGDTVELDFPKTDTFTMIEKPRYSSDFNPASIGDLMTSFRNSLAGKTSDLKIVMYRDRAPQSLEEKLIVKIGKTLWIPSTDEDLPINDPDFSGNIVVKKEAEDFLAATGTAAYLVRSEIANLLYTKAKSNIVSEIHCPVLYHEYAVGYIQVVNRRPRTERLDQETLNYVIQFSRVLSYSLEINGYYQARGRSEVRHQVPVIDMSASGLLFTTAAAEIDKKIDLFHDLTLHLEIGGRSLVIGARIMRKFKDAENYYFAAQFLEFADDDLNFVFEFLYGKPYSDDAQGRWEGGTPPPRLPPAAPPPA